MVSEVYTDTYYSLFSFCQTKRAACLLKPWPWPDMWQAYRKTLFSGLIQDPLTQEKISTLYMLNRKSNDERFYGLELL